MKDFTRKNDLIQERKKYYCGIDIHKKKSYFYVVDNNAKKVFSKEINTTTEDYKKLLSKFNSEQLKIAIEIGNLTFTYCQLFKKMGIEHHVVNTLENSYIGKSMKKTDKEDARKLSIQLCKDILPEKVYVPSEEERDLRRLVAERAMIVKSKTRLINSVTALLSQYEITVKKRTLSYKKTWNTLKESIENSDDRVLKTLFMSKYRQAMTLIQEELEIGKVIKEMIIKNKKFMHSYELLISVPGIGFITASALIALIGDITRFPNVRKFVNYFGTTPRQKESGGKKNHSSSKITKKGNGTARGYATQCALSLLKCKDTKALPMQEFYAEKLKKKGWKKARVALSRKILAIAFGVLKNNTPYDPEYVLKKKMA